MDIAYSLWLDRLLDHGESVQTEPPPERLPAASLVGLENGFRKHALDMAGPMISFQVDSASRAAMVLARHCWAVACGDNSATGFGIGSEPDRAAEHLSADLLLRFFPMIHRRARLRAPESELVGEQETLLRAWPLSGVLADIEREPTTPLTFDNHPGLMMLYAERLVQNPRAGWLPADGLACEWVERIFHERGKPLPARIAKEAAGE